MYYTSISLACNVDHSWGCVPLSGNSLKVFHMYSCWIFICSSPHVQHGWNSHVKNSKIFSSHTCIKAETKRQTVFNNIFRCIFCLRKYRNSISNRISRKFISAGQIGSMSPFIQIYKSTLNRGQGDYLNPHMVSLDHDKLK